MIEDIKNLSETFFKNLGINFDSLEVENQEKNIFLIKVKSEDSGMLIGPHGKNLGDIQNILKLITSKNTGEKIKINIEVNDYMKSKDERLIGFIESKIRFLGDKGGEVKLPFLSAYDRKKVHSYIAGLKDSGIVTESRGEGKNRRIFLCKTGSNLSIDIDGEDI